MPLAQSWTAYPHMFLRRARQNPTRDLEELHISVQHAWLGQLTEACRDGSWQATLEELKSWSTGQQEWAQFAS